MTTIAIVGAGPGLGVAVAQRFATEGFAVALISRTQENVDRLASVLNGQGFSARGYAADVRDPHALVAALTRAGEELGPIEVLQFSPIPQPEFLRPVLETAMDDFAAALEFSLRGPVVAVHHLLPVMRALGRGSVLLVNGGSAALPNPKVAGTSVAFAAESAYAQMLHDTLAEENIRVRQLIVPGAIRPDSPHNAPAVLAERLWALHTEPGPFRAWSETPPVTGTSD